MDQGTLSVNEQEALSVVNNSGYSEASLEISSSQTLTKEDVIRSIQNSILTIKVGDCYEKFNYFI